MKRLLVIMLILVAIGLVSAATITVHADTRIECGYRVLGSGIPFKPATADNVMNIYSPWEQTYEIQIKWWSLSHVLPQFAQLEYAIVHIYHPTNDIHLYYQFVTGNEPTNPINQ